MRSEVDYWDAAAEAWGLSDQHLLWRVHSDAINRTLFARWQPQEPVERLLKTDLFDEACGEGLYGLLTSWTREFIGMDLSLNVTHAARSRHTGIQAVGGDVRRLPFGDSVFSVVVSDSTLDHFQSVDQIVASLREISRVLSPGGRLLLTLDNVANPAVALRNALPFGPLHRLGIVPYYVGATCSPRQLQRILQQLEFEVLAVKAVLHCPRVLAVAAAGMLEKRASRETQRRFLRFLGAFEVLARWPTRFLTGYFVGVKAIKR